jgi:FkbM family methyltransferase
MQIQNKAPYLFRPSQILRRIRRTWNHAPSHPVDVVLPWGLKMTVDPGETIGRTIWNSGIHDLPVCEVLYRLAGQGETAVDAGANIGLMTGLLAGRLGAGGRVYSFEAHPAVYEKLCRHAALWKAQPIAEIMASPRALSSSPGTVTLIPGTDFLQNQGTSRVEKNGEAGTGGAAMTIEATTLDLELPEKSRVGVMKIDVEGHELEVLAGARELLASRSIRDILFEDSAGVLSRIMEQLKPSGYSFLEIKWSLLGPSLRPVEPGEGSRLRPGNLPNYLATLEPERAMRLLKQRGWHCLHPKPGRNPRLPAEVPSGTA